MAFKIKVAASAGFCFGVRKALDRLIDIRNNTTLPVRTLGPLIHNEQVLQALKNRAVHELDANEDITEKHVVLRAHGVTPDMRKQLQEQGAVVCDATCPKVGQVQAIVKKFSRKNCPVIIIGDRGHAEVVGLLGYCPNTGLVVTGPEEAEALEEGEEVCVVAQTTQDPLIFNQTVNIIRKKFKVCHEHNTICDATTERQTETKALAIESDIMVVVGAKNSANTMRLADIAKKNCKTIMIQSADNLKQDDFQGVKQVAVTAGASTPAWVIREVVERIRMMGLEQSGKCPYLCYNLIIMLAEHHVIWALGLGLLTFAMLIALTGTPHWLTAIIVTSLIMVWRTLDHRLNPKLDTGITVILAILAGIQLYRYTSITQTTVAVIFLGSVFFIRLLLYDCLNVQADKISGHDTIPSLHSRKVTDNVIQTSIAVLSLSAIALMVVSSAVNIGFLLLIPAGYALFQCKKLDKQKWCDLRDVMYLDLPIWLTAIMILAF
jgi:(E)-4-hydroxy-3-methyl-but-2-enyl pyrophosphate reductase